MNASWYHGQAQIEMGGQELTVDYNYLIAPDDNEPQEWHGRKITMMVGISVTGSSGSIAKYQIDVTDLMLESATSGEDFWDHVREVMESNHGEDYYPCQDHPNRTREYVETPESAG